MSVWLSTIDTVVTYHSFVVSLNNGNDNGLTSDKRICTDSFDTIRISYFILEYVSTCFIIISRTNVYEGYTTSGESGAYYCLCMHTTLLLNNIVFYQSHFHMHLVLVLVLVAFFCSLAVCVYGCLSKI